MKTVNWKKREWILSETWGQVHPDKLNVYYCPECVHPDREGNMHLYSVYKPKYFDSVNTIVPMGIGMMCCMDEFHFGKYSIDVKLPAGKHMWAAIWLYNQTGWESEIDIVEAYSNRKGSYLHPEFWKYPAYYKLDSNFHYHVDGVHKMTGTRRFNVGRKNPTKRFINFGMTWTPEFIHLFADGKLQRELSGDVMEHFQKPMRFLINTSLKPNKVVLEPSDFIIKDFTYIPYKI